MQLAILLRSVTARLHRSGPHASILQSCTHDQHASSKNRWPCYLRIHLSLWCKDVGLLREVFSQLPPSHSLRVVYAWSYPTYTYQRHTLCLHPWSGSLHYRLLRIYLWVQLPHRHCATMLVLPRFRSHALPCMHAYAFCYTCAYAYQSHT